MELTRDPPSHWDLPQGKRLALGAGTDVKSLATFSSGPDPSVRQQAQMEAQKFLTPLRPLTPFAPILLNTSRFQFAFEETIYVAGTLMVEPSSIPLKA